MYQAWQPGNFLDWGLAAFVGLGALAGYRRGLLAALASLAAYGAALAIANLYSDRALVAANRSWGLSARLTPYLALAPGLGPDVVHRILGWLAFGVVFTVAHLVGAGFVFALLGRVPQFRANAWLGLAVGALERVFVAGIALAVAVNLGRLPGLQPVSAGIAGSHWAPALIGWVRSMPRLPRSL